MKKYIKAKKENDNIAMLSEYITAGYITDQQAKLFVDLLNGNLTTGSNFFIFCFDGNTTNVDSATPQGLYQEVQNLFPSQHMNVAFNYQKNKFGELVSLDRLFVDKVFSLFV